MGGLFSVKHYTNDMMPDDHEVTSIEEANAMSVRTNAIVIAYVVLVVMLGIIGNAMVFIFHGYVEDKKKKTVTTFLITVLAVNDFMASAVLSNHIIILKYLINFQSKLGCQITYFLNHFFVTNSLLLLNPIGIERCLRVCIHNPRYHLTKRKAIVVLCVIGGINSTGALKHVWVAGVLTFEVEVATNQTVTGHVCSFLRDNHILPIVEMFNLVDMIGFVTTNIVLIIVYSLMAKKVGLVARKVNAYPVESHTFRNMGTRTAHKSVSIERSNTNTNNNLKTNTNTNTFINSNTNTDMYINTTMIPKTHVKTNIVNINATDSSDTATGASTRKSRRHDNCERKINVMLGTVTLASILIFMPYFYVVMFIRPEVTPGKFTYRPIVQLAWRSFMLNSAINPYIIGLFNSQFRRFVINLLCRCKLQSV